ncbi:MAG: alcohol dehydrogenase catalytic domain-containing protein [Clostridia bacterium]|nr:alcohol dehydrogenase catalytic domain-containing protein [Clostridia bacterium]
MKALVIEAPGKAKFFEAEKPTVRPGDVLCRVVNAGICGTDLSIFSGDMNLVREGIIKYPVRIGHEWSGIVEEIGSAVTKFKPGDKVVSDTAVTCGVCEHCLKGEYEQCEDWRAIGTIKCWNGSFAEYILIPDRHLFKIPDGVRMDDAALTEPMTIALSGIKAAKVKKGDSVLVIGTGAIGLSAVALAKYYGASTVIVSGRKPFKLDVAKKVGADVTVNSTQEDLVEGVMKATDGKGVDVIVETSGDEKLLNQCVAAAKQHGMINLIGFFESKLDGFDIAQFMTKNLNLSCGMGAYGLAAEIVEILATGKIDVHPLITHRFVFDETIDAMKTAGEKNATKIKMMVEISKA